MKEKIQVHIADDHKVLIDGIIAVLKTEKEIEVVGCSLNGEQVLQWYKKNTSDVLILDINMPKVDGISVLQEFKKINFQPNVIILSSYDDVKLVKEVMKIGAKGFLAKKCASEEIIEAIKRVSLRENYFSKDIQNKIVTSFSEKGNIKNTKLLQLITDREKEVLVLITKELNTREIAESLFISVNLSLIHI